MRDPQAQDAHAAARLEFLDDVVRQLADDNTGWPVLWPGLWSRLSSALAELRSLRSRLVVLEQALGYIARSDSWQIVGLPEQDMEGTSLQFIPPDDSVYATPWGFARSALAAVSVADIPQEHE